MAYKYLAIKTRRWFNLLEPTKPLRNASSQRAAGYFASIAYKAFMLHCTIICARLNSL